jgi:hypothetical protein
MIMKVTAEANHGWPVDVSAHHPKTGDKIESQGGRVPANETWGFYIHSSQDLRIHEVQPDEVEKPTRSSGIAPAHTR